MIVKNLYTSVGVNKTPTTLDWGINGLVCFGAAHAVAIFDPSYNGSCKLTRTLSAHTDRVNSTKWISRNSSNEFELISGADDSRSIYWNIENPENPKKIFLEGHKGGVTAVDGIYVEDQLTVATVSTDSTIQLWRFNPDTESSESITSFQTIDLKTGICFNVKFVLLPNSSLLLACNTDDDNIHFYGENIEKSFEKVETLRGHEDWVRGLDFTTDDNGDILLASSSQDHFIRLWRISPKSGETEKNLTSDLIQVDERVFTVAGSKFVLSVESVLQGHENRVYSVHWSRNSEDNSLQLLSSSMDKTMIVWAVDQEQSIWSEKIRVGDVGGNSLGFYGAKFNSEGNSFIGHGFLGSLHLWRQNKNNLRLWEPGVIGGGHFKEVKDIAWEPKGKFIFSVSIDQTTRIHADWLRDNPSVTYHEIARPQVHGYDMQCIAVLSRYKFASAAEEKIVRTFQAPGNFVENFRNLVGVTEADDEGDEILETHQKGASVPSLGLSNKAVYEEDLIADKGKDEKKFKDEYPENYFMPITMTVPPTEEYLTQNTLWPELQKLYAHGYELFSLAATRDGKILASACKSTTVEHSEIILWNTSTWKVHQRLRSHKLTVTQMKFSSDGNRLLSVSRDRRWTMFENKAAPGAEVNFEMAATTDKQNGVHERIIWSCSWSHDGLFFATGSRDGKVVVWSKCSAMNESSLKDYQAVTTLELKNESITAVSFAHQNLKDGSYLLAVGLESGEIQLHKFNKSEILLLKKLDKSEAHHLCVNKLEFRPESKAFHLASCGNDHLVKIYDINPYYS